MAKLIIVFVLMLPLFTANACEHDIHIAYPPFIKLLTINQFFSGMHNQLSTKTGCNVKFVLHTSFEEVLDGILEYRHEATILPSSYISIAKELGYQHVATINREDVIYILARKEFKGSTYDFSGLKILILDHYSESGAIFKQDMELKGMLSQVNIHTGGSYDQMILSVMKKRADLAVIIPEYWHLLSPDVRDKHLKIVYKLNSFSAGIVTPPSSELFTGQLHQVLLKEGGEGDRVRWKPPVAAEARSLPLLEAFIKSKVSESLEN